MTSVFHALLAALVVLAASPVFAQPAAPPQAVAQAPRFEFGAVVEGAAVVHDFVIANNGAGVLEIASVKTG